MSNAVSSTESRALDLLGQGLGPEVVANALGLSTSRISQLISDPEFSAQVAELRYKNLAKHNERDNKYDSMEDKLLERLEDMVSWMTKPMEVLKAIQIINAAKRRGSSAPEQITNQNTVINLVMPTKIVQQFQLNGQNQVVKAGEQALITVQSGHMSNLLDKLKERGKSDVQTLPSPSENSPTSLSTS